VTTLTYKKGKPVTTNSEQIARKHGQKSELSIGTSNKMQLSVNIEVNTIGTYIHNSIASVLPYAVCWRNSKQLHFVTGTKQ
jgi:hypothetical protein